MNQTKVETSAETLHGQIKAKWGKLSEKDISESESNMDVLSGKIQTAYGRTKEIVDREVTEFRKALPSEDTSAKLA